MMCFINMLLFIQFVCAPLFTDIQIRGLVAKVTVRLARKVAPNLVEVRRMCGWRKC